MKKPEKDGTANDPLLEEFEAAVRYGQGDPVSALVELLSERPGFDRSVIQLQGTTVAGYRLEQLVGVGGVGATYRAIDAAGSEVAVKIMGGLTGSRRQRFDSECTILRGLAHPNIVRYRDHGVLEPDKGFLVMDYVRGANLETVLLGTGRHSAAATVTAAFRGPLATDQEDDLARDDYRRRVIRIVAKIARAVHAAHDAGIIHRDLKPGNVMLSEDLEPMLIDFGLSRNLRRDGSLTDSHLLIGTLAYMAPEQLEGNPDAVDGQADVFALGLILYRLLVGEDLRSDVEAVVRYRRRPLVLERTGARVLPVELRAILYRCLEVRKQDRYADALILEADLMAWLDGRPIAARRPLLTTRWLRRPIGRGAAVAGLGAAIVSLVIAIWPPPEARTTIDCLIDCGLAIDEVSLQRPTPFIGLNLRTSLAV